MRTRLRVLVADDHEQCRWALERLLSIDFEVVAAVGNGKKVVEAVTALQPDVIISDISMPLMTGIQAMEELRAKGSEIPFVLVSTENHGVEAFIERGAMAFVHKVDMGHDLVAAVVSAAKRQVFVSRNAAGQMFNALKCA